MIEITLNQTWYDINLDTEFQTDILDTAATIEMKFKSPRGVETLVPAQRVGTTSVIVYVLTVDKPVLNEIGQWAAWPYITALDGRVAEPKRALGITVVPSGRI